MKKLLVAALLVSTAPAFAQDNTNTVNSGSASDATAVSGSQSGASSDNTNANTQGQTQNNAGIGNSTSGSSSNSGATAITGSSAESNGNQQGQDQGQGQTQGQSANNAQDQGQGQDQAQSANNSQGQSQTANAGSSDQGQMQSSSNSNQLGATNSQGVTVNQTWNTNQRKKTIQEFRTNTAVMLAASSSFSSDYCGGTASGGASTSAPIGLTIGGSGPTFDNSCRYLRLAEKAGMLGANYYNMQQPESAMKAMSLMSWAVCMSGPQQDKRKKGYNENQAMQACIALGLLGSDISAMSPPPQPVREPQVQYDNGYPTPEASTRNTPPDVSIPKTPRGDAGSPGPVAMAGH